jgi:hypothetical protein
MVTETQGMGAPAAVGASVGGLPVGGAAPLGGFGADNSGAAFGGGFGGGAGGGFGGSSPMQSMVASGMGPLTGGMGGGIDMRPASSVGGACPGLEGA